MATGTSITLAVPLEGGAPITVCDSCASAFGTARIVGPPALVESGREMGVRVAATLSLRFTRRQP